MAEEASIFDLIPNENQPDFRTMSDEEVANQIANTTGLAFKNNGTKVGQATVFRATLNNGSGCDIHISKYVMEERKGEKFIACDVWKNNGWAGCSIPCDSIEEAVDVIRRELLQKGK